MKNYYIESKNSMGYVLMHVGSYKNYKEFRKSVNTFIATTCLDNYYRDFKMYPRPLQILLSGLSFFGMKIKVKKIDDINKINLKKYYCPVTELFRTESDINKYSGSSFKKVS